MKKFLLSLAALAMAATMSATSYQVFLNSEGGSWSGDGDGWGQVVSFGNVKFTVTTAKVSSTASDLVSPVNYAPYAWRVYKGTSVSIKAEGCTMKSIVITFDDYSNGQYMGEWTLDGGWSGVLDGAEYTLSNSGTSSFTGVSTEKQTRVNSIIISDSDEVGDPETPTSQEGYNPGSGEIGGPTEPDEPDQPEAGVIYSNTFESSISDWEKVNDSSLSDFSGWKINSSPKCAICNSYYGGENHPADAKLQKTFDLTGYNNVAMSFSMGFGYDFPTKQNDNYRVYVISGGNVSYLTMANFPPAPTNSNWTSPTDWATNVFDLSEYDGETITIGFEYLTDGTISRAWEIKDFKLYDKTQSGISSVMTDDNAAPVYYNLQGVRVNAPEKGLFIVVKGGKSSKVLF